MSRNDGIGLDRRLDLVWLDTVAAQVAAGADLWAIRAKLFAMLDGKLSGGTQRGRACHKTVGVIMRTWVNVPDELIPLRDDAMRLLPALSQVERVALHWAMLLGGFAFFGDVATSAGRLLELQGRFTLSQLTRRMRESRGDRSTVSRATQRVVRSMVQWGGLADGQGKGIYVDVSRRLLVRNELAELLLAALLLHEGRGVAIEQALRHRALFPFDVELTAHGLRQSRRFEVDRQGLDVDVVRLA